MTNILMKSLMVMSLDSVLIISFTGIFVGIILLLFSNDEEIKNNFFTIKTKSGKIFYILSPKIQPQLSGFKLVC